MNRKSIKKNFDIWNDYYYEIKNLYNLVIYVFYIFII